MSAGSPFLIDDLPGYAPQISHLVVMLNYARRTTLEAAADLTVAQLDHLHDERSNSIGALLAHIAAVEFAYQLGTFEQRGLTPQERRRWGAALQLGPQARAEVRGKPLSHYLELLSEVRTQTLAELSRRTHDWLPRAGGRDQPSRADPLAAPAPAHRLTRVAALRWSAPSSRLRALSSRVCTA